MAFPVTIDSGSPIGSDSPAQGDDELRGIKGNILDITGLSSGVALTAQPTKVDANGQWPHASRLTNNTGGSLVAGDVVALDTAANTSVKLGNVASALETYLIARESINSAAVGLFVDRGVCTVKVTGTVTRGDYIRKSATTKSAETTGVSSSATTAAPAGTIGLALTSDSGGFVTAYVYGGGAAGSGATSAIVGHRLTNKTGGSISAGDVVPLSNGTDSAVTVADVAGSYSTFLVAAESVASDAIGTFYQVGIVSAKAQGTITRGDFVRKSATSKAVESAGGTSSATIPPPNSSLGIALADATGGFVTCLWFGYTSIPRTSWYRAGGESAESSYTIGSGVQDVKTITVSVPLTAWLRVRWQWILDGNNTSNVVQLSVKINSTNLSSGSVRTVWSGGGSASDASGVIEILIPPFATGGGDGAYAIFRSNNNSGVISIEGIAFEVARPNAAVTGVTAVVNSGTGTGTVKVRDMVVEAMIVD